MSDKLKEIPHTLASRFNNIETMDDMPVSVKESMARDLWEVPAMPQKPEFDGFDKRQLSYTVLSTGAINEPAMDAFLALIPTIQKKAIKFRYNWANSTSNHK